jgi:hypothetical protein
MILDVLSHHVVEAAELAETADRADTIENTILWTRVLTLHAIRGTSMRPKSVAQ